jgi:23S rRNA (uracil1939-C5)-methyltransferase
VTLNPNHEIHTPHLAHCDLLTKCGSCPLLHDPYNAQLAHKQSHFEGILLRSGFDPSGAIPFILTPPIASPQTLAYRHTAKLAVRPSSTERPLIGLFRPGTHEVIEIAQCPVQTEAINTLIETLREEMAHLHIRAYDERTFEGLIRYVVARESSVTGTLNLTLVVTDLEQKILLTLGERLMTRVPALIGIQAHENTTRGNAIFDTSGVDRCLIGSSTLQEAIQGLTLQVSSTSFYQVNPSVATLAYQAVVDALAPRPGERALDLYCGVGSIGLLLARAGCQLWGVEETASSLSDAMENARRNSIDARWLLGRAEEVLSRVDGDLPSSVDIVALNPSRRGCQLEVIEAVTRLAPRAIAYMSCHPRTLLRDLRRFRARGYAPHRFTVLDMFPGGPHYEVVCALLPIFKEGDLDL